MKTPSINKWKFLSVTWRNNTKSQILPPINEVDYYPALRESIKCIWQPLNFWRSSAHIDSHKPKWCAIRSRTFQRNYAPLPRNPTKPLPNKKSMLSCPPHNNEATWNYSIRIWPPKSSRRCTKTYRNHLFRSGRANSVNYQHNRSTRRYQIDPSVQKVTRFTEQ
jgi:hypothetical protein